MIGHLILKNAVWSVISDLHTGRSRIVLLRSDHSASACFERECLLIGHAKNWLG